jgi:[acyl-carrier-protein] S-malonyltransferase
MSTAFVFPGQGSQIVGMGKALAAEFAVARRLFDEVDAALGQSLSRLMFEGPDSDLTLTVNAQPALMAVSVAAMAVLQSEAGLDLQRDIAFVAGHSLGEYSALAAAGALSVSDAARLLRRRGVVMQNAVPVGVGGMAALLGADVALAAMVAAEAAQGEICAIANDNGGGQVVLSGHVAAVARAIALAKARGVKRALALPVSAPFHCALMQPAADAMAEALDAAALSGPDVPLVANVLARPIDDPAAIRRALVDQVCGTVRWRESIEWLVGAGVTHLVEVGSGKVLTGLAKRIAPELATRVVGTPEDVASYASARAEAAR